MPLSALSSPQVAFAAASVTPAASRPTAFSGPGRSEGPAQDQVRFSGQEHKIPADSLVDRMQDGANWKLDATGKSDYANPAYEFELDGKTYQLFSGQYGAGEEFYIQRGWEPGMDYFNRTMTRISKSTYEALVAKCQEYGTEAIEQYFGYRPGADVTPVLRDLGLDMLRLLDSGIAPVQKNGDDVLGGYRVDDMHHEVKERGDHFTLQLPADEDQPRAVSFFPKYEEGTDTIGSYIIRFHDGGPSHSVHANKTGYTFSTSDPGTIQAIRLLSDVAQHFSVASLLADLKGSKSEEAFADNAVFQKISTRLQEERERFRSQLQDI